jgi:tripartite-type tricarboxylate transporter receptor subunit TctC
VPGYHASAWYGLSAPKKTPVEIIVRLIFEVRALSDPKLKQRRADLGAEPLYMTEAGFEKFVSDEIEKWGKMIKFADIKG